MKKLVICCMIMMVLCRIYGQDSKNAKDPNNFLGKAFSYTLAPDLNLKTGMSYKITDITNLFSQDKVKSLKVTRKIYEATIKYIAPDEITYIYTYEHGLLNARYYSRADVDPDTIYEYDSLRRLIKLGKDFTYSYPEIQKTDEIERTIYYLGDYYSTEKVRLIDDGYEVYIIQSSGTEDSEKFVYEDELLKEIISSSTVIKDSIWNWSFKYENKLLKEIIWTINDDIQTRTKVLEYDDQNILQLEDQIYSDGRVEHTKIITYSNYDEYGNWHDAEIYANGKLNEIVHRVIEYY